MKLTNSELAGRLYERYCVMVGGKAFNGDPLPTWSEFSVDPLKTKQADAWRQVAVEAMAYIEERIRAEIPDLNPSAGHDALDELMGLRRVALSNLEASETMYKWSKEAAELLRVFANNSDPVYDTQVRADQVKNCPSRLEYASVKRCSLCGAHGQHNQENLTHHANCIWMKVREHRKSITKP